MIIDHYFVLFGILTVVARTIFDFRGERFEEKLELRTRLAHGCSVCVGCEE
jgi:hypothetical protein